MSEGVAIIGMIFVSTLAATREILKHLNEVNIKINHIEEMVIRLVEGTKSN